MRVHTLKRQSLGFFPTPLAPLQHLSRLLGGPEIYIKRDDMTGLALGGNKTRKLEFILGEALAQGADCLLTAGAVQSNHCRQTAAAAAQLGLECHLLLGGEAPSEISGNLLLDELFGAQLHWRGEHRKGEDLAELASQLRAAGKHPWIVPYGGSDVLGAAGFVQACYELDCQLQARDLHFDRLIFASSSGATQAGLMVGKQWLGWESEIVGIGIDRAQSGAPFDQRVLDLAQQTAAYLALEAELKPADVLLDNRYLEAGYGVVGAQEREAISLLARHEGIVLDPVYTGRAMAGLIDLIRREEIGAQERVLFWHTGGAPALFAYAEQVR